MLFSPLAIRGITLSNRIMVSPMCQYSSNDGFSNDWHLVHLGSRAAGGAGLIVTEATAVDPRGRISPRDLGIWKDEHIEGLARIARFITERGSIPGIQLAHAGRKGSTAVPWEGEGYVPPGSGGWQPVAPSAIPFSPAYGMPEELTADGVAGITAAFATAARRAREAGFRVIELHFAHGYLVHEFLSPLSNHRTDSFGGSFENRTQLARDIARAVRAVWPEDLPLFARFSCTDWLQGGWDVPQSVRLARALRDDGVDLVDCSSGGVVGGVTVPIGPGYQTGFAETLRREASVATGAVGLITSAQQADHVLRTGQADLVVMGRQLLRDPYWPLHAAAELKAQAAWPSQYLRART
jgi:2,4-dienoyl-CoA reductase-like NADH-dependent reductase (Old Yellow Enzyme family)